MEDKRGVGGLDLMFGAEVERDAVFPGFEFSVQLADGIEQFSVALLRGLDGIELAIDFARDDGKLAHEAEEIDLAFAIGEWDVANVVGGVLGREFNIHVIIVLSRGATRSEASVFIEEICDPKHPLPLFDLDRVEIESGSTFVEANSMRASNSSGNEEKGWLRIWGALQKQGHAQQRLNAEEIRVPHGELGDDAHGIFQVQPGLLIIFLWDDVAHDSNAIGNGQGDVDASPPTTAFVRILGILLLDQMHKGGLVEQGKHAVEVFEKVLEERHGLVLGREGFEDSTDEDVAEDFRFPILPFVVFFIDGVLDGFLERGIAGLLVDPLDAFGGEDGKGRGRAWGEESAGVRRQGEMLATDQYISFHQCCL